MKHILGQEEENNYFGSFQSENIYKNISNIYVNLGLNEPKIYKIMQEVEENHKKYYENLHN